MRATIFRAAMILCFSVLQAPSAEAHKPSDAYLSLSVEGAGIVGQWDIALRDLDVAIGLDADANGEIAWGEVRSRREQIEAYALARLDLAGEGACPLKTDDFLIDHHSDGAYAVLRFSAACPRAPEALAISYRLFADIDPQHKGLLKLRVGDETRSAIFSPEEASQRFVLGQPGTFDQFVQYFASGVEHIWTGYDHILFLISLLLPAALSRHGRSWTPRESFRAAASDVFRIVTAFTLAHSITLALATLQIVAVPSRLTESAIAFSVVLAALNNVFPIIGGRRWAVAGAFGLVHGFGFASVLIDLGLPEAALALALAAFNLGVEAGQIAIVLVFLPVAWRLRHTPLYRRVVMTGGSLFIAMLAAMWLVERALYTKASLVLVTAS